MEINRSRHPLVLIVILIGLVVTGLFISQFIILATLYPFMGDKVFSLASMVANPGLYPDFRYALLYVQGVTSLGSMVVAPLLFFKYFYNDAVVFAKYLPKPLFFLITALLVIISMPANAWIAELNMKMQLPSFLSEIEKWMAAKETELKTLTEYLTQFQTNGQFLIGLVVIALIPAVGEELLFRGGLQNLLENLLKNKHLAVWCAAIIFSAIHLQFYGFIPRLILGALFGYLYLWTGNILIPMTGHFVNNGFTLLLIHMKNNNQIKVDLETTQDIPASLIIGSFLIFSSLMTFFYFQASSIQSSNSEKSY